MSTSVDDRLPVIVRGARTAFLDTAGAFSPLMNYQLAAAAIGGVLDKTGIDPALIDTVALGAVVPELTTTNVAREAMLSAGLPSTTAAFSTSMAGLSPNIAIGAVCDQIQLGRIDLAIAGGSDTFSDPLLRLGPSVRRALMKLNRDPSPRNALKLLHTIKPRDLLPQLPTATDLTTGMTMGDCAEAMARKFGVVRADCDRYAAQSHARAVQAWAQGRYDDDIAPVSLPGARAPIVRDDTPRADAAVDKLARLKPAFDASGVITAGNASRLTDGAGVLLLASAARARELALPAQAVIRDYILTGVTDLSTEMLLGPAMAIPKLLRKHGLKIDDIGVWELHEAFAAQLLANQNCLKSTEFARAYHGLDAAVGAIPEDRLNTWGGSLALGNPFAATGVRLLMTAARRLQQENQRYAIVSSCAGGGLGAAMLLEAL